MATATAHTRPETPAPAASAGGYDAFVSYSHAADGRLAPALQHALQAMAKPWYRRRALRVFRDQTSLTATPELWGSIEQALTASRAFILLASPASADSPWVEQEAAWWRAHRGSDRCFIALTDGELDWDDARGDFTAGSAVPPSLRGWFASEPLWVDLRWVRTHEHLSPRDPRFRDSVADLAAPLHGVPKDELVGEDVRLHRRAIRLARGAVALLVALTVLAAVGAVVAIVQRNTARDQSSLATARQIAATATGALGSRLDVAHGLAAEAYARRATDQTEAALFAAVSSSPHLVRFRSAGAPVTALSPAASGDEMLVADAEGRVRQWSLDDGRFGPPLADLDAPVTLARVTGPGLLAVGDDRGNVVVRPLDGGGERRLRIRGAVTDVAVNPAGRWLAAGSVEQGVSLFDLRTSERVGRFKGVAPGALRFTSHGVVLVVGSLGGGVQRFLVPQMWSLGDATFSTTPANDYAAAWSPDRRYFGFHKFGMRVIGADDKSSRMFPYDTATAASAVAIGPRAERTAVAAGGTIAVLRPRKAGGRYGVGADPGGLVADVFTGLSTTVTALAFTPDSRRLVSAAGDVLALWDPGQRSRIARRVETVEIPDTFNLEVPPGLALSGDRAHVLTADEAGELTVTATGTGERTGSADLGWEARPYLGVLLDRDGRTATVVTEDGVSEVDLERGTTTASVPLRRTSTAALLRGPDGRPVVVFDDGSVTLVDMGARRTRKVAGALPGARAENPVWSGDTATAARRGLLYATTGTRLWSTDLATGRRTEWRPPSGTRVERVSASADGRTVVTADGQASTHVWDGASRRVVRTLDTGPVSALALDARGTHLAVIQRSGTMSLWRPATGTKLGELPLSEAQTGISGRGVSGQTAATFAPDGTLWTAITGQGLLRWDMSPRTWMRVTCTTVGRSLTADEWRRYLGIAHEPQHRC